MENKSELGQELDGVASDDVTKVAGQQSKHRHPIRQESRKRRSWFGRIARYLAWGMLVFFLALGGLIWFAINSAQTAPEFYQNALTLPPEELTADGKEFEASVFELQNQLHDAGQWQTLLTDEQINGWLASDLPEKFPDSLPPTFKEPRVSIGENEIQLAFQLKTNRFSGVIVSIGDVFLTKQLNEIAIRLKSTKTGFVPIPIGQWADQISDSLRSSNVIVSWTEMEGDPVAIISLPRELLESDDKRWRLDSVKLLDSGLFLSGTTTETKPKSETK